MTSILTVLSHEAVGNGWRQFIETGFKGISEPVFTHVDSIDIAIKHLREKNPSIVIFGTMGDPNETYLSLAPYMHRRHVPILICGDLHTGQHIRAFEERSIKTLHLSVLDTLNFYLDAEKFVERYQQERTSRHVEHW
jgi:hypothetical protein